MSLSRGKRLVHLDLKGAPPRTEYLLKLIELFADLGANGVLVEYEDMFPYEGELSILQAKAHSPYSREEILLMQDVARSRGLEIVPLVQTFGHLEFFLKHKDFCEFREVEHCLGTLNPHKKRGVMLVVEMLRQVMELHPHSSSLHIGADEVYMLGQGQESKQWLSAPDHSIHHLFLSHVSKVAKGILEKFPDLSLIMWDDMLRGMNTDIIKDSGLVGLVQPMLWDYSPYLDVQSTVTLMDKYRSAGLSQQWVASSFKGSTTVHTCVTNTQWHVENHLQWLKVVSLLPAGIALQGTALTGWQRYDHLSVLCELLPLSLPSLASCLQTLLNGSFAQEAQSKVAETLGISNMEVEAIDSTSGDVSSFVGKRLAVLIVQLMALVESEEIKHFESNLFVRGWFTPYHRRKKIVNPLIANQIHTQATMFVKAVESKVQEVRQEMSQLYPNATVEEWVEQHVTPVLQPLQSLLTDIHLTMEDMGLNPSTQSGP